MDTTLNLNVVKTETAPCSLALKVEVLPPRVKKSFGEVIAMFSQQVKIPGFRAGKVPANVICKRFGEDVVNETKKRLMDAAFRDAVKDENLRVVGEPDIKESDDLTLNQTASFNFTVEVETAPAFDLPEYKGLALSRKKVAISDADVDSFLATMQERNTKYDKADKPAAAQDMVRADYTATVPEGCEVTDKSKYLLNGTNSWLVLKQPEMLPGVSEALIGHSAGDEVDAAITFPEGHYNQEIAGKTFNYHIKINEVHTAAVPALDDEFAKTVGLENLEQLRQRVRENLTAQAEEAESSSLQKQVTDFLENSVDFALPAKLLAKEKNAIAGREYQDRLRRGAKKEDLEPQKDQMLAEAETEAAKRMRLEFVIDAIAEAEKVSVDQNELVYAIQQYAQMQGRKFDEVAKELTRNDQIPMVYQNLRFRKTIDAIIKLANVTETAAE